MNDPDAAHMTNTASPTSARRRPRSRRYDSGAHLGDRGLTKTRSTGAWSSGQPARALRSLVLDVPGQDLGEAAVAPLSGVAPSLVAGVADQG